MAFLNSSSVERIILQSEMDLFKSKDVTNDPNPLHTKKWRGIPYARDIFKAAPVPGLMGAGTLEFLANEFLAINSEQQRFITKISAIFPDALYTNRRYAYQIEPKQNGKLDTLQGLIKENADLKFRVTYTTSCNAPKEQSIDDPVRTWFSTTITLNPEQFRDYLITVNSYELIVPATTLAASHFFSKCVYNDLLKTEGEELVLLDVPPMFVIAATASQAMFQKFGQKANGKAYFKFSADLFKTASITELEDGAKLTVYVSDHKYSDQRKTYEINIVCALENRTVYSATATLFNLADLAKLKKEKETQNKTETKLLRTKVRRVTT